MSKPPNFFFNHIKHVSSDPKKKKILNNKLLICLQVLSWTNSENVLMDM